MNSPLEHDHEELNKILRNLFTALDAGDAKESFRRLDLFWACLAVHIRAEHVCLFPAILRELNSSREQRCDGYAPSLNNAREAIAQLHNDHDFFMRELASAIKQMRDLHALPAARAAASLRKEQGWLLCSCESSLI